MNGVKSIPKAKPALCVFTVLAVLCLAAACTGYVLPEGEPSELPGEVGNGIHILNTGWEDAIVLESNGHYALVDTGEPGRGAYIVNYLQRQIHGAEGGHVYLDFVVGTHSHIDHMGSFAEVLSHPDVTVGKAYFKRENGPAVTDEDLFYERAVEACQSQGVEMVRDGLDGLKIGLGDMSVTFVNGAPLEGRTTNADSLCQLVEVGGYKALLAGDMVTENKESGVYSQIGGTVDLLKVGHHGQRDSTGKGFANSLRPKVAVYTSGSSWEMNTQDVTLGVKKGMSGYRNLKNVGAVQYVTTDNGGILATFDGEEMRCYAIKEFSKKNETPLYEYRGETLLRPI